MSKLFQYNSGPLYDGGSPRSWNLPTHEFGPYNLETTQRYIPGTRFTTWDGRVFKYGRTITTLISSMGAFNASGQVNIAEDSEENPVVGKRSLTFLLGAADGYAGVGVAEDELAGGFITTGHGESKEQTRLITGNTLAAASAEVTIYIDFPWNTTMTTDTTPWTEVMLNPYRYLNDNSGTICGVMGIAVRDTTALQFTWIQSYGPLYMTGTGSTGGAANERDCYVVGNGSVRDGSELTIEHGYQRIGWIIDQGTATMPMVMLQISI